MGALVYEGLAASLEDAANLAASGEIAFDPCHHHHAVGPMAGVISPSMPVWIIENTEWPGLVILDTKSDLEALTVSAWRAADRILVPIADWASLEEAGKIFRLLDRCGVGAERARVVFTLVDRRSRVGGSTTPLYRRLVDEVERRGWRRCNRLLLP